MLLVGHKKVEQRGYYGGGGGSSAGDQFGQTMCHVTYEYSLISQNQSSINTSNRAKGWLNAWAALIL